MLALRSILHPAESGWSGDDTLPRKTSRAFRRILYATYGLNYHLSTKPHNSERYTGWEPRNPLLHKYRLTAIADHATPESMAPMPELDPEHIEKMREAVAEMQRMIPIEKDQPEGTVEPKDEPDGPVEPTHIRLNGVVKKFGNAQQWKLLRYFWKKDRARMADVMREHDPESVFDSVVDNNTVGVALSRFRGVAGSQLGWTLRQDGDIIYKESLPSKPAVSGE